MRILVTGHKGYIGTVMVPMLLAAGHDVVGLDSDLFRQCTFGPGIHDVPELQLDLRDAQTRHLEGFDAVAHLGVRHIGDGHRPVSVRGEATHHPRSRLRRVLGTGHP